MQNLPPAIAELERSGYVVQVSPEPGQAGTGEGSMNQASHVMPIGVLPGQLSALWAELCALRHDVDRLERERDQLRREVEKWKAGALCPGERPEE